MKKIIICLSLFSLLLISCDKETTTENVVLTDAINLSVNNLHYSSSGDAIGVVEVEVKSSSEWVLSGRRLWSEPSLSEGKDSDKVTFTLKANSDPDDRTAIYTFICGSKIAELIINQEGAKVLDVETESNPIKVSFSGEMLSVRVNSNIDYKVGLSYKDEEGWITPVSTDTKSMKSDFYYFQVNPSASLDVRTATITFTAEGQTPKYVTVQQDLKPKITITKTEYNLPIEGGSIDVEVNSNTDYDVVIPQSVNWITKVVTKGLETSIVRLDIAKGKLERKAEVEFRTKDKSASEKIIINQEGMALTLVDVKDPTWRASLASWGYVRVVEGTKCEVTEAGLSATYLSVGSSWNYTSIGSVEGIEGFVNLTQISINKCNISTFDISKLKNVTYFDPGNNPLSEIHLGDNAITSLGSPWRIFYNYSSYSTPSSLTVTGTKLEQLNLSSEQYKYVDVSGCPALNTLDCTNMPNLWRVTVKKSQNIYFINVPEDKKVFVD